MKLKYFGTDGIRGTYGSSNMHPAFAFKVGVAVARHVKSNNPAASKIILGKDTRSSGTKLSDAIIQGIQSEEIQHTFLGIVPTPVVAETVIQSNANMGIMITASHNPAQDNGIKLFSSLGTKLPQSVEREIESLIDAAKDEYQENQIDSIDSISVLDSYLDKHKKILDTGSIENWKIAIDTANGATCKTTPRLLERLVSKIYQIGNQPEVDEINAGVGSEYPEKMAKLTRDKNCNIGFAHDGDGDRLVVCDETGSIVSGEEILGILAILLKKEGKLKNNKLVTTLQSNMGLDKSLQSHNIEVIRTEIGDRHVAESMRQNGLNLGGENSGHYLLSDHSTTGDGMIAALELLQRIQKSKRNLSELRNDITLFPQRTKNLKIAEKKPLETLINLQQSIENANKSLANNGRILIRYSGTENKLRLLVEANERAVAEKTLQNLLDSASKDLHILDS